MIMMMFTGPAILVTGMASCIDKDKWLETLVRIVEELNEVQYKKMQNYLTKIPHGTMEGTCKMAMPQLIISTYGLEDSVREVARIMKLIPRNDPTILNLLQPFEIKKENEQSRPEASATAQELEQNPEPSDELDSLDPARCTLSGLEQYVDNPEVRKRYIAELQKNVAREDIEKLKTTIRFKKLRKHLILTWEKCRQIYINQKLKKLGEGGNQKKFPLEIIEDFIFENNSKYAKGSKGRSRCSTLLDPEVYDQWNDDQTQDQADRASSAQTLGGDGSVSSGTHCTSVDPCHYSLKTEEAPLAANEPLSGPDMLSHGEEHAERSQGMVAQESIKHPLRTQGEHTRTGEPLPKEPPTSQKSQRKKRELQKKPVATEDQQKKTECLLGWASEKGLLGKRKASEEEDLKAVREHITFVNVRE
ncbi:uncharacterized protein LOC136768396 [Amia ocellicauda]|uniref:uncharacterized protein LOC136768396 n=1 Tax=Amia ocellicauda TaxID=2972642 RepID=UPI0034646ACB